MPLCHPLPAGYLAWSWHGWKPSGHWLEQGGSLGYSDHQCSEGEEKDEPSLAANLAQVYSWLDSKQRTAIVPMGNGWEFVM